MLGYLLSFVFGVVLAPLAPVLAFLTIVILASAIDVGIAITKEVDILSPVLRISGEAASAQIGYVAGVLGLVFVEQMKTGAILRPKLRDAGDIEDDKL